MPPPCYTELSSILAVVHHQGIIHRDIKPANLLWTSNRTLVKIIDFGVSHFSPLTQGSKSRKELDPDDDVLFPEADLLRRIGTPSFLAPEVVWFADGGVKPSPAASSDTLASELSSDTVQDGTNSTPSKRPPVTKAIDIWSLAVTFYCFLFGHTPFNVPPSTNTNVYHNEFMLYNQICTQDWAVDDTMGVDGASTGGRHPRDKSSEGFMIVGLLDQMLQKDPRSRVTLREVKVSIVQSVIPDTLTIIYFSSILGYCAILPNPRNGYGQRLLVLASLVQVRYRPADG
jgi:serine/threonine protein kinase